MNEKFAIGSVMVSIDYNYDLKPASEFTKEELLQILDAYTIRNGHLQNKIEDRDELIKQLLAKL